LEIGSVALPDDHDLILASDFHEGTILQEVRALRELREKIERNKNTYLAFGGDAVEAITVDDKRYSGETTDPHNSTPLRQYRTVKNFFAPIARKTIFILQGNHDWTLARTIGDYLATDLCPDLGIPYGTATCKWTIKSKRGERMYKIFFTHGAGSISSVADDPIRRESNMLLSLKRKLSAKAGDCEVMCMGHTHRLMISSPMSSLYLYDNGYKIRAAYTGVDTGRGQWIHPDHRFYVNTGSFLKLYGEHVSGYAERAGYDPVELGYAVLECRDGKIVNIRKQVVA
jgi:predicted phosphodiesterase